MRCMSCTKLILLFYWFFEYLTQSISLHMVTGFASKFYDNEIVRDLLSLRVSSMSFVRWPIRGSHCSLLTSHCPIRVTSHCRSLPTAHSSLLTACSLLTAHCSLLTAHCSLLTAHCSQLTAHCSLLTVHCSLLTAHCSQLTAHCSLLTAHCSLLTAHCSQLTAHCSLLTAHCSLLTAHCSLLTVHCSLLTAHCSLLTARCRSLPTAHFPLLTSHSGTSRRFFVWPGLYRDSSFAPALRARKIFRPRLLVQLGFMYVYRKYLENEESLNTFTLLDSRALSVASLENFIILISTKLSESDFKSNFGHTVAMFGKPHFRVSL